MFLFPLLFSSLLDHLFPLISSVHRPILIPTITYLLKNRFRPLTRLPKSRSIQHLHIPTIKLPPKHAQVIRTPVRNT